MKPLDPLVGLDAVGRTFAAGRGACGFQLGARVLRGVVEGGEGVKVTDAAARLPSSAGVWAQVARVVGRDAWGDSAPNHSLQPSKDD
jgi:NADPH:quinone reductase-like Zn-dependent oxidoreductase